MNKKNNRKGFTTVELVIVIAVIAILATVLIPTFSSLIGKANDSAALQAARNALNVILVETTDPTSTVFAGDTQVIVYEGKDKTSYYAVVDNKLTELTPTTTGEGAAATTTLKVKINNSDVTFTVTNKTTFTNNSYDCEAKTNTVSALKDLDPKITVIDIAAAQ